MLDTLDTLDTPPGGLVLVIARGLLTHVGTFLQTRHAVGVTAGWGTGAASCRLCLLLLKTVRLLGSDADLQGLVIVPPESH